MREIRFRGLRTDGKGWVYGHYFYDRHVMQSYIIDDETNVDVFSDSVGQFTGLKDRNGKYIYEGDLVNVPYNYIGINDVKYIEEEGRFSISKYKISVLEIIGNIHEQQGGTD